MSPLRSTVDESNQHGVSEFSSTPCMRSEVEISVKEDDSGEIPGNGASHHRFNLGKLMRACSADKFGYVLYEVIISFLD